MGAETHTGQAECRLQSEHGTGNEVSRGVIYSFDVLDLCLSDSQVTIC